MLAKIVSCGDKGVPFKELKNGDFFDFSGDIGMKIDPPLRLGKQKKKIDFLWFDETGRVLFDAMENDDYQTSHLSVEIHR